MDSLIYNFQHLSLKDYDIDYTQPLGSGSKSRVFPIKNQNLVVKEIPYNTTDDETKLKSQLNSLKAIYHPNITEVIGYDFVKTDTANGYIIYLFMEKAKCNLAEFLKMNPEYFNTDTRLADFMIQMCCVGAFLEDEKICHKRIEPENILVFEDYIFKFGDLGLLQILVGAEQNISEVSRYRAPELYGDVAGKKINFHKADVYSMGQMFLELCKVPEEELNELNKFKMSADQVSYECRVDEIIGCLTEKFPQSWVAELLFETNEYDQGKRWFCKHAMSNIFCGLAELRPVLLDYCKKTHDLYEKYADKGDAHSQNNLGYIYQMGLGVEENTQKAKELYQKSADQGNSYGQNSLGYVYLHHDKDYEKAFELLQLSVSQDNPFGISNLAFMYENGIYVEKDLSMASALHARSTAQDED